MVWEKFSLVIILEDITEAGEVDWEDVADTGEVDETVGHWHAELYPGESVPQQSGVDRDLVQALTGLQDRRRSPPCDRIEARMEEEVCQLALVACAAVGREVQRLAGGQEHVLWTERREEQLVWEPVIVHCAVLI